MTKQAQIPPPEIIIERLSLEKTADCDAVIDLWYDGDLIDRDAQATKAHNDLQNCYASGRGSVLIARQSASRPVMATIMVGHDGTTGWVHYLAVAPSLRGQGHGATMLEMAENILSAVGLATCKVHAASPRAAKFYRRRGYRQAPAPDSGRSAGPAHTDDARFYEKRLTS
ncbi:GNAT family N-acetyltransferase [Thalassospira mesophila]|uniref:GNAT family N-acetyltransferase n=1 Tax=Thalassospira mesophila TaxID=1293891 RepID=UPI0013026027|nr:GNAT family N-acetyltransferase [Thalassospira mesophila]